MVDPEFSEFQFTYGLMRELDAPRPGMGILDVPIIPTQHEESVIPADVVSRLQHGGIKLTPLFLQFKRAERMKQSDANEYDEFDEKYYRFDLYLGTNNQHNRLVRMSSSFPLTFYVGPQFHTRPEYRRYAVRERLRFNSAFIPCHDLRTVTSGDHVVAYTDSFDGRVCSESEEIQVRNGVSPYVAEEVEESIYTLDALRGVFADLRGDVAGQRLLDEYQEQNLDSLNPLEWVHAQRRFFRQVVGTELLFFTSSQEG